MRQAQIPALMYVAGAPDARSTMTSSRLLWSNLPDDSALPPFAGLVGRQVLVSKATWWLLYLARPRRFPPRPNSGDASGGSTGSLPRRPSSSRAERAERSSGCACDRYSSRRVGFTIARDGTTRAEVCAVDNFAPPFDLDGRWIGEANYVLPPTCPSATTGNAFGRLAGQRRLS